MEHCARSKISSLHAELTATTFTTWIKEENTNLGIAFDRLQILTANHPKLLVYIDSLTHAAIITPKLQNRNKVFKALACNAWCMDKENLLTIR